MEVCKDKGETVLLSALFAKLLKSQLIDTLSYSYCEICMDVIIIYLVVQFEALATFNSIKSLIGNEDSVVNKIKEAARDPEFIIPNTKVGWK